ncbi:MAG TPA: hypothetical protein VJN70_11315 [Gemmatimonadaceae bacterium]|nr:hypothetical protein [Gemmatimonadaceae bacterium]
MARVAAALSGILFCAVTGTQSETRNFVIRDEADSIAVEQTTRSANTLTGDLRLFQEGTNVHYVLHLRPDGSTESADVFNESPGFFTGTIVFGDPSASLGQSGAPGRVVRVPANYAPIIGTSMALIDNVLRLHARDTSQAIVIKVLNLRNHIPGRLTIKRLARDSVLVDCESCMRLRMTEELRIALARDGGIDGAVRVEQHWTVGRR